MVNEDERCRLAVNELKRIARSTNGLFKPQQFEKVAKQAKVDVRSLYQYIKENEVIL